MIRSLRPVRSLRVASLFIFLALAACYDGRGHDYTPGYSWYGSYGYGPYGFGYGPYGYGYYGYYGYRPYYWYGHEYYRGHHHH
jgi:hypothetical protein